MPDSVLPLRKAAGKWLLPQPKDAATTGSGKKGFNFPNLGMMMGGENPAGGVAPRHLSPWKTHHARQFSVKEEARKEIENMPREGDRKSIEYVGRKDADPKSTKEKTSRLATIRNVIDEAVKKNIELTTQKKFVYPNGTEVVINPDSKRVNLDVEAEYKKEKK